MNETMSTLESNTEWILFIFGDLIGNNTCTVQPYMLVGVSWERIQAQIRYACINTFWQTPPFLN